MTLDEWIWQTRISQTALARVLGCNPATVSRIRHGLVEPTGRLVVDIQRETKGAVTATVEDYPVFGKPEAGQKRHNEREGVT